MNNEIGAPTCKHKVNWNTCLECRPGLSTPEQKECFYYHENHRESPPHICPYIPPHNQEKGWKSELINLIAKLDNGSHSSNQLQGIDEAITKLLKKAIQQAREDERKKIVKVAGEEYVQRFVREGCQRLLAEIEKGMPEEKAGDWSKTWNAGWHTYRQELLTLLNHLKESL